MFEFEKERENLCRLTDMFTGKIDETVAVIEELLEKLSIQREEEISFLHDLEPERSGDEIKSSFGETMDSLKRLCAELNDYKKAAAFLSEDFDWFLSVFNGGKFKNESFVNGYCLSLTSHFREMADKIINGKYALSAQMQSIFEKELFPEKEKLFDCISQYTFVADRVADYYRCLADYISKLSEMSLCAESNLCADVVNVSERVEEPKKQDVPPPPSSVCANPYFPKPSQIEDEIQRADKARRRLGKSSIIRSLVGELFSHVGKRKEKVKDEIVPPVQIDEVQFSAIAEKKVVPGKYLPLNIVMYEDKFKKVVDEIASSYGENFKKSTSGYHNVERNSMIKVVLTSGDITVEDNVEEQEWNGKYLNFEFAVKIPEDFSLQQVLFKATVYVNDIIATNLKLVLDCDGSPSHNIRISRFDIISAFVSYASQDRSRVAAIIQGMKKARPDMDIFFDVESLRSGQNWEDALKSEIESRDILFLCWSKYAKESKWVDMEWRHAFNTKGEDCIEPIPIDSPESCPPPAELRQKHFNDKMLYIIKTENLLNNSKPILIRIKTNEYIVLNKPVFRLGREEAYVDFCIKDNPSVSRCHANIVQREGQFFIVDTNSANHVFVNDVMIPCNAETPLTSGTIITLADEKFKFVNE